MKKKNTLKTLAICTLILVPSLIVTTAGSIARGANTPTPSNEPGQEHQDWPAYGGAPENNHYSKLAQINRSNAKSFRLGCRDRQVLVEVRLWNSWNATGSRARLLG